MSPRLDQQTTRQLWAAVCVATVLFVVALTLVLLRLGSADPVLQRKDSTLGSSAVSGSR